MPIDFEDPDAKTRATRNVLILCDKWSCWTNGIASVNQSLATKLAGYSGVKVYSTVLVQPDAGHVEDTAFDYESPVNLIRISVSQEEVEVSEETALRECYKRFNNSPLTMLRSSDDHIPDSVSYLIGHAPLSAAAAVKLRDTMYPTSKVILFYHSIPDELRWAENRLAIPVPEPEELVRLAEAADVVYSVTQKVYWYYAAKFRTRARVNIDHRLLIPQCNPLVFETDLSPSRQVPSPDVRLVAMCNGAGVEDCFGLDIAVCAAGKVAAELARRAANDQLPPPDVSLTIINISPSHLTSSRDTLRQEMFAAERAGARVVLKEMSGRSSRPNKHLEELQERQYDLCLLPQRSEPLGYIGLVPLSGGLPTLIAEDSTLAQMIQRLTSDPDQYLVKTTRDMKAVKQDAEVWRQRILQVIDRPGAALAGATLLKSALKRDEQTRETHDNFITLLLGGIGLKMELTELEFIEWNGVRDGPRELETRRRFNKFLLAAMRQCWRVKHHPLQSHDELRVLSDRLPILPVQELISRVVDAIEDRDRRIIGIDCQHGTMIVYCPDVDSLRDLWAMCDRINNALRSVLLPSSQDYSKNPVLAEFSLRKALTRVIISGPEFLRYKHQLVQMRTA